MLRILISLLYIHVYSETSIKRTPLGPFQVAAEERFVLKGKYHEDTNFGTRLSVRLIKGVRLIGVHLIEVSLYMASFWKLNLFLTFILFS